MGIQSREILAIGTDGNTSVVPVDADIFGTGVLADRPTTGDHDGDIYVVNDPGQGIFRMDMWDGSQWQTLAPSGNVPTASRIGQVLYSENGSTFTAELPITSPQGWLVNDEGLLVIK